MTDTALPVVKAVITRLRENEALRVLIADRIFTHVKEGADFPYVVVRIESAPDAGDDFSDQRHAVRIHGFSREKTIEEALRIRALACASLDRQENSLPLDEGKVIICQLGTFSTAFLEDNGKTWQSIIEFDILVGNQ